MGGMLKSRAYFAILQFALFRAWLMAKPIIVTLPLVLFLLDFWPLKRLSNADMAACRHGKSALPPMEP